MGRLNAAEKVSAIAKTINIIKDMTNTADFVVVGLSKVIEKNHLSPTMLPVLRDMKILNFEKEGGKSRYQWGYGAGKIDTTLAEKVYEGMKAHERNAPSKLNRVRSKKVLNPTPAIPVSEKPNSDVAAIASTQKKTRAPYMTKAIKAQLQAGSDEVAPLENVAKQLKEVEQVKPTPVITHKRAETAKAPQKAKVVEKLKFTDAMGTIFGYKQLAYMQNISRKLLTSVVINENITLENVKNICFKIEGSNIGITFYNDLGDENEPGAKVAELRLNNTVIGLREQGGDTTSSILRIALIPVTDPFNVI